MRIQQLENQLRQLTGQNEELQYRNRQLEERLQGAAGRRAGRAGGQAAGRPAPTYRRELPARRPAAARRSAGSPSRASEPQIAAPAPIVQEPPQRRAGGTGPAPWRCLRSRARIRMRPARRARSAAASCRCRPRRRSALPAAAEPASRSIWPTPPRAQSARRCRRSAAARPGASAALTTLPPSATPKDEFDLGIGYMQRKDYALAEETMRNFAQKYPSDPLIGDSQYWLGESFFQRQQYRDAAEAFLGGDHQIRQIGEGPGRAAAARPVAGGAEGKGSRLRRARRGDAEISRAPRPA